MVVELGSRGELQGERIYEKGDCFYYHYENDVYHYGDHGDDGHNESNECHSGNGDGHKKVPQIPTPKKSILSK